MDNNIKLSDFRWMWQGQHLNYLAPRDQRLVLPITEKREGCSKALLMLHGFTSTPAAFRRLLPELPAYDGIYAPLLPGHGESIDTFTDIQASAWIAAAESAVETLLETYEHVDVLGLSLGGLLATYLGQRYPLHHLWLLAPALAVRVPLRAVLTMARIAQKLGFVRLRARPGDLCTRDACELAYRQVPLSTLCEILQLIRDFSGDLPTCPTDVFLGRHDQVVNSEAVAALFMDKPNATLHWLKDSAHVLSLDTDFRQIAACMRAQIKTCETA